MSVEWDIEELAYRAMGKTESETDTEINYGDIDDAICDKYGIDFDTYCKIVKDLLPFTPVLPSSLSLTPKYFHAFVDNQQQRAIVKIEAKP